MSIIEQVKELKAYSNISLYARENKAKELLRQAADTIEALSTKLQAANAEWSADCGGWIPCKERLPSKDDCGEDENEFNVTVNADGLKTMTMEFVYEKVRGKEVCRWKWKGRISPWEVIAWKPLPDPYRGS